MLTNCNGYQQPRKLEGIESPSVIFSHTTVIPFRPVIPSVSNSFDLGPKIAMVISSQGHSQGMI